MLQDWYPQPQLTDTCKAKKKLGRGGTVRPLGFPRESGRGHQPQWPTPSLPLGPVPAGHHPE